MPDTAYDIQALTGAAEFFENMATGANSAPLAFAQAIRRANPPAEPTDSMVEVAARAMARVQMARNEKATGKVRGETFKAKAEDYGWPEFAPEARAALVAVFAAAKAGGRQS